VHLAETHARASAFVSRWCAGSTILPDFAHDPGGFVDGVIELCAAIGWPVIITSHDGAIEALRARRDEVERVATLALASEQALALAIDKRATLAVAQRLGVPVPHGVAVTDFGEAAGAIDTIGLPIVIKPVVSWVGDGPVAWRAAPSVARTRDAALAQIKSLIDGGVGALVQQWLCGSREAVSLIWADGRARAIFAQRAHRMSPLIGGSSVVRESIPLPADIGPMSEALVSELSLEGYAEIEFRRDQGGRPFLMEINPRLSASVEIAVRAGVNFPLLLYDWAAARPAQAAPSYGCGRRMRWLKGDLAWLLEALRDPEHPDAPRPLAAIGTFVGEFARLPGYDYWDWGDLRPAALVTAGVARSLPRRVARRLRRAASAADIPSEGE
jgi:predicted ATP-grasp superfamily ATP-dependent carboligase